jgi:TPR repeat protein
MEKVLQLTWKLPSNITRLSHLAQPSSLTPQKAANLGIPPAVYNLANMYASGRGCEQSDEKAFNCYAIASSRGDKPAKYFYATFLSEGRGCEKDLDLAIKLFVRPVPPPSSTSPHHTQKELAETGHPRAAHNLGVHYLEGQVVNKDPHEAVRWFTIGAKGGLFQSTFNLGKIYFEGNQAGVPTDLKKAEEWFAIALVQSRNDASCLEYLQETRRLLALEKEKLQSQ